MEDLENDALEALVLSVDKRKTLEDNFVPGTYSHTFFSARQDILEGKVASAKVGLENLKKFPPSHVKRWCQILEYLIHFKGWEESEEGREELKLFLRKEFDLDFSIDPHHVAAGTSSEKSLQASFLKEESTALPSRVDESILHRDKLLKDLEYDLKDAEDSALYMIFDKGCFTHSQRVEMTKVALNLACLPGIVDHINKGMLLDEGKEDVEKVMKDLTLKQLMEIRSTSQASYEWMTSVICCMYPPTLTEQHIPDDEVQGFLDWVSFFVDGLDASEPADYLRMRVSYVKMTRMIEKECVDIPTLLAYVKAMTVSKNGVSRLLRNFLESPAWNAARNNNTYLGPLLPVLGPGMGPEDQVTAALRILIMSDEGGPELFSQGSELGRNIQEKIWRPILEECMLLKSKKGEENEWAEKYIASGCNIQLLHDHTYLQILSSNTKEWGVDEKIKLDLKVKNIDTVVVKTYEIDSWSSCCAHLKDVDIDVDLEGLGAMTNEQFEMSTANAMKLWNWTYESSICRRGVFVIEFVGGGFTSKALIKKGGVRGFQRICELGHAIKLIYEDSTEIEGGQVWMGGQTFDIDPDLGEVIIPFHETRAGNRSIVMGKPDGLAACIDLYLKKEEYTLEARVCIDPELVVPYRLVPLMIRADLKIHGQPASMSLFEDVKLEVTTADAEGVENVQEFQGVVLPEDRSVFVQNIRVPNHVVSVQTSLTGRVELSVSTKHGTRDPYQNLEHLQHHSFNSALVANTIHDMYLSVNGVGEFTLRVLGKCGECLPGMHVKLGLKTIVKKSVEKVVCQTDETGCILLGTLKGVTVIEARCVKTKSNRSWYINTFHGSHTFEIPIRTKVGEGSIVSVPIRDVNLRLREGIEGFRLFQVNAIGCAYRDVSSYLYLSPGYVCAKGLPVGQYSLICLVSDVKYSDIFVIKPDKEIVTGRATRLSNSAQALAQTCAKPMQITHLSCSTENGLEIQVDGLQEDLEAARLTVIFNRFLKPEVLQDELICKDLVTFMKTTEKPTTPGDQIWMKILSSYTSNKSLSDETRYVLDRLSVKPQLGNMLQKPSLLIYPFSVRVTKTDRNMVARRRAGQLMSGGPSYAPTSPAYAQCMAFGSSGETFMTLKADKRADYNLSRLEPAMPFCPHSTVIHNAHCGVDGSFRVSLDELSKYGVEDLASSGYTNIQVLVTSPSGCVTKMGYVATGTANFASEVVQKVVPTRNLDDGVAFIEHRVMKPVMPGESVVVSDISSGKFRVLTAIADVWGIFMAVMEKPGFTAGSHHGGRPPPRITLVEFSFLLSWESLTEAQKLDHLTKNACHELHFFIKMRDPVFFNEHVKPILSNKMKHERGFMDMYLIDDEHLVSEWSSPVMYATLNAVEKCLLLSKESPEKAQLLAQDMFNIHKSMVTEYERNVLKKQVFSAALAAANPEECEVVDVPYDEEEEEGALGGGGHHEESLKERSLSFSPAVPMKQKKKAGRKVLYHQPLDAHEWQETGYWKIKDVQDSSLVDYGEFWADFAKHLALRPSNTRFLSQSVLMACRTFTEAVLAIAVCDLPLQAIPTNLTLTPHGSGFLVKSVTPVLVCNKETMNVDPSSSRFQGVSIIQNIIDPDNPTTEEPETGQQIQRIAEPPLKSGKHYKYIVVAANSTGSGQDLELLVHVPEGSLPLGGSPATASVSVHLSAFQCEQWDFNFYFPDEGEFSELPATIFKGDRLLGVSAVEERKIKVEKNPKDTRPVESLSWPDFAIHATDEQILNHFKHESLAGEDLSLVHNRMRNPQFYSEAIEALRNRNFFDNGLWSWSVYHLNEPGLKEWLQGQPSIASLMGPVDFQLYKKVCRDEEYRHLEYFPLVNARSHRLKGLWTMQNKSLKMQWKAFLEYASWLPELDVSTAVEAVHYLLVQDRIEEGAALIKWVEKKMDTTEVVTEMVMQVDLMRAWLDVSDPRSNLDVAHEVSRKYSNTVHGKWGKWFKELHQALEEIEAGSGGWEVVDESYEKDTTPVLHISSGSVSSMESGGPIAIEYRNIDKVKIGVYLMDIEILFSSSPFSLLTGATRSDGDHHLGKFSYVKPSFAKYVDLDEEKQGSYSFQIQDLFPELGSASAMVAVSGGGLKRSMVHFGSRLKVQVKEKVGVLVVGSAADNSPIAGAYVKVYARSLSQKDLSVFHKDGYTDRRGKFDYATLSSHGVDAIDKFAIFVSSKDHGVVTVSAGRPAC